MSINYKAVNSLINFEKIFKHHYVNSNGKYIIKETDEQLYHIIYDFINIEDKNIIKNIVNTYGIFNAIKLYQNTYCEDFHLNEITYINTYIPLCYEIIEYIINKYDICVHVYNDIVLHVL